MDSKIAVNLEPQSKTKRVSLNSKLSVSEHQETQTDEVSRYKSMKLVQFSLGLDSFVSDSFSVIQS